MPQLAPISLVAPGSYGLNKENEYNLLDPRWATEATNCVISAGGRLSSRKGWSNQTSNAVSGNAAIDVIHEYIQKDGTTIVLSTAGNAIYKNVSDFTAVANDITSTTSPTADHWQFVNFNDYVIGVQKGHAPIQWQNSGDFTDISFTGTGYDGNCVCAAFGRVWAADADLQTLRYSSLLDHTDMSTTGGVVDMSSVWTNGMDQIVAVAALGSNLIVFGKRHIIIWADGSGSEIGLDPLNMYVVDTIEGTGCIARDSVQAIGEGDLWYLSRHGIQSLSRVIQDKNNPITAVTKNIRTTLNGYLTVELATDSELDAVRSVYDPVEGMYLLLLPGNNTIIYIDARHPFTDADGDKIYPITDWEMGGPITAMGVRENGDLLLGAAGVVGKYEGNQDNGSSYSMPFWSGWLDLGELNERLKMVKELSAIIQITGTGSASYRWEFDWSGDSFSKSKSYVSPTASEFNISEWNIGEFSGTLTIQRNNFAGSGQGQYIRIGAVITVDGFDFTIQQLQIIPAIGRLVA